MTSSIQHPVFGAGLIIGQPDEPTVPPELLLYRRAVEKAQASLPPWAREAAEPHPHVFSPIVSYLARSLLYGELSIGEDELPKLVSLLSRAEAAHGGFEAAKLSRRRELKRLFVLGDYLLRRAFPGCVTHLGFADLARMLREHPEVTSARRVMAAAEVLDSLAARSAGTLLKGAVGASEEAALAVSALSFTGLYFQSLLALLRTLQNALFAEPAPPEAAVAGHTVSVTAPVERPATPLAADVVEVDGAMVRDLVNYALSVYAAARTAAFASLGGRGAQVEVERGLLGCITVLCS